MTEELLTLPHNLDAERAILGAILVDNLEITTAQSLGLGADEFFRDAHRRIYHALDALTTRRSGLDLVTLAAELRRTGDLEEVGGPVYVAGLIDGVPRTMNVPHYVGLVQEAAQRRALMALSSALVRHAANGEEPAAVLLDRMVNDLLALSTQHYRRGGLVEGAELSRRAFAFLEEVEQRRAAGGVAGIATGFIELDQLLDGFHPGHLVIVGGRTSEGKSALALQFALASESCAFFSCEMEVEELAMRMLAVLARIDGWSLRRGLASSEHARVSRGLDMMVDAGVAIDDTAAVTLGYVRAQARRRQLREGLRLIVVDYLQLMGAEARREGNREQEVAGLARGLKAIAKELRVPVIALSQFNRTLKPGEKPTLAHLRESGELEQAANVVILIHREDAQSVAVEGDAKLIIAKNRGGPKGEVTLRWIPRETRFADAVATPEQGAFR